MDPVTILVIVLLLCALGGGPWVGWGPSGVVGLLLLVLLLYLLFGRGPRQPL